MEHAATRDRKRLDALSRGNDRRRVPKDARLRDTNNRSRGSLRPATFECRVSASMLASVAPLAECDVVRVGPDQMGARSRASSIKRWTARPSACTTTTHFRSTLGAPVSGGSRLLAKRGGGIPVKIGSGRSRFSPVPNYRFPRGTRKSLIFAPGIVLEARNRSALIACVEAGNSGIRIIRIILN